MFLSCGSDRPFDPDGFSWDVYGDYDGEAMTCDDQDNDTISDEHEGKDSSSGDVDTDRDGTPDYLDADSDNDGLPDSLEAGNPPCTPPEDLDSDGDPNFRDLDSDGNGIYDQAEGAADLDLDGKPDFRDLDNDGDNIPDAEEIGEAASSPVDYDGDTIPDYLDIDSDNDTIHDRSETRADSDGDGNPDFHDHDTDGDTIPDATEAGDTDVNTPPVDTDGDLVPDFRDVDSDNDGLSDEWEYAQGLNPYSEDSDGDGVTDLIEVGAGTDALNPDSNPRADGNFFFIVPYMEAPSPDKDTLVFSTSIKQADVYFLVDTTGSMNGEIVNLRASISTAVIPGMVASIPDVWVGVGYFDDYPYGSYGVAGVDESYQNLQNINGDPALAQAAAAALPSGNGDDIPESHVTALFTVATGDPSRTIPLQPAPSCPAGTMGYPCYRTGSVPIIILISDAPFHNGPGNAYPYSGVPAPSYAETVAALTAASIKVIGVHSGGDNSHYRQLAIDTGAVDVTSNPLVYNISSDGTGLGEQVINAVAILSTQVPISVSAQARDDTSEDTVDATIFIDRIVPNTVDAVEDPRNPGVFCVTGLATADTDSDTMQDTFTSVLPGQSVCFDIFPRMNETVEPLPEPQVFKAFVDVLGDHITLLDTRDVYFLVPPHIEGPGGPD